MTAALPLTVSCSGCAKPLAPSEAWFSRNGQYALCGSGCRGDRLTMEPSAFAYFKAWTRTQEPRL